MKQLEVATLQEFQLQRSMEAQKIDYKSVPEFKPQNWEKKIAKADLENRSYESGERQSFFFIFIKNLIILQAVLLKLGCFFQINEGGQCGEGLTVASWP